MYKELFKKMKSKRHTCHDHSLDNNKYVDSCCYPPNQQQLHRHCLQSHWSCVRRHPGTYRDGGRRGHQVRCAQESRTWRWQQDEEVLFRQKTYSSVEQGRQCLVGAHAAMHPEGNRGSCSGHREPSCHIREHAHLLLDPSPPRQRLFVHIEKGGVQRYCIHGIPQPSSYTGKEEQISLSVALLHGFEVKIPTFDGGSRDLL